MAASAKGIPLVPAQPVPLTTAWAPFPITNWTAWVPAPPLALTWNGLRKVVSGHRVVSPMIGGCVSIRKPDGVSGKPLPWPASSVAETRQK